MDLNLICDAYNGVDKSVQKLYSHIGKNIPEENIYVVATALNIIGTVAFPNSGELYSDTFLSGFVPGLFIIGPDMVHNIEGLMGNVKKINHNGSIKMNPFTRVIDNYIKKIRLPVYLSGMGFLAKGGFELANYFVTGDNINPNTYEYFTVGISSLCVASSMYLKDQDPKLTQKKPSKVKAVLEDFFKKEVEVPAN